MQHLFRHAIKVGIEDEARQSLRLPVDQRADVMLRCPAEHARALRVCRFAVCGAALQHHRGDAFPPRQLAERLHVRLYPAQRTRFPVLVEIAVRDEI